VKQMREIVLDTETTGLSPGEGHRIVEIGCIELVNHLPTGKTFHRFMNPGMKMPAAAQEIHGHTDAFLADKPDFAAIADELLAFLGDAKLVIHNAAFDMGFLNAELERAARPPLAPTRAIDTVEMARRKFPGAPANLDALCRRFSIDNSARTVHGALLDAELLAEVYLELIGGRQPALGLAAAKPAAVAAAAKTAREPRPHEARAEELAAHAGLTAALKNPIWDK
jgi:DNA polymerase-3 subunit epsilon